MTGDSMNFEEWSEAGEVQSSPKENAAHPLKFRPIRRPPIASLYIFDDGQESGETVRVRTSEITIGKNADISIPHDDGISDAHVTIRRRETGTGYVWLIKDHERTTGLFVRMRKATLNDGTMFLAGSDYYLYSQCVDTPNGKSDVANRLAAGSIPGPSVFDSDIAYPSIKRFSDSKKIWLIDGEYWIGRDSANALSSPHDPFLGARHVLVNKPTSRWMASSFGITNGFWVKLRQLNVTNSCTFQIGEQRFRLTVGV